MTARWWPRLLLVSALWGSAYLFIEVALEDLAPPVVVFSRLALGAVVLVPPALAGGALEQLRDRKRAVLGLALAMGVFPFLLIAGGQVWITSSLAGILVATTPIFTALLAICIDHEERPRGRSAAGIAAGIVGVTLLLGVDVGGELTALAGALMVILASLGYALAGFIVKHRLADVAPVSAAAATLATGTVLTLPAALATLPDAVPAARSLAALLALGLLCTGLTMFLFYGLIGTVGPARASLVTYLAPSFSVIYGIVLLGERLTPAMVAGLALIVGGSWLAGRRGGPEAAVRVEAPAPQGTPEHAARPGTQDAGAVPARRE
jgi:drug/metabolite transporter (DMT)-like permease